MEKIEVVGLENIVEELKVRAEIMKGMPRLAENDEHNEILQNIKIDEMINEAQEMYDYLHR